MVEITGIWLTLSSSTILAQRPRPNHSISSKYLRSAGSQSQILASRPSCHRSLGISNPFATNRTLLSALRTITSKWIMSGFSTGLGTFAKMVRVRFLSGQVCGRQRWSTTKRVSTIEVCEYLRRSYFVFVFGGSGFGPKSKGERVSAFEHWSDISGRPIWISYLDDFFPQKEPFSLLWVGDGCKYCNNLVRVLYE